MATVAFSDQQEPRYRGLRMTADQYFEIEEDGFRYELIDGVVCMSPSPTPKHQRVLTRLAGQIVQYLECHGVGEVMVETDVHLGQGPRGGDLVYRPDIVFLRSERAAECRNRLRGAPDLVVEVVSAQSRDYDGKTKKSDYERCGVHEYWLIDPERQTMTFYRLQEGRFAEAAASPEGFASEAVPGFVLDTRRVRASFAD